MYFLTRTQKTQHLFANTLSVLFIVCITNIYCICCLGQQKSWYLNILSSVLNRKWYRIFDFYSIRWFSEISGHAFVWLWQENVVLSTFASEIRYPVRLSTERTPANTNCCFRNLFILVVTYGKEPCFYQIRPNKNIARSPFLFGMGVSGMVVGITNTVF